MVMAVSPILVVFGAIYHWYPKVTGRMLNDTMGKFHFWVTFLGTYAIYYPMHYLGLGVPRRYYALGNTVFIPGPAHRLNEAITIALPGPSKSCSCTTSSGVFPREAIGWQPLARHHAGVADPRYTAEARQLWRGATGGLSLGLRLQRARRRRGLHTAKSASD
jgi:hypothetical protein